MRIKTHIYRTPTSREWAAPGRNRWVRASSEAEARQICREEFGAEPVEVMLAPDSRIQLWERTR